MMSIVTDVGGPKISPYSHRRTEKEKNKNKKDKKII